MKIIKLGIISFIIFFILLLLMSLLIPSRVRVSRAINIDAPRATILTYVRDTANWRQWNELKTDLIRVEIESSDSSHATTRWHYKGRDIESTFRIEESAGVSVIQWYFEFRLNWYPWEKFGSITFDKQFGKPMETSLDNLEKLITNSP